MNEKPFVLPIKTPLGYYIYEISRNEIIRVGKELYDCVQHKLHNVSLPSEYAVTDKGEKEYAELFDCGYLQPNVLNEIRHPQTDQVELFLDRGLQQLTLQVTQDCNLRCSYCVYSGNNDANQRSHSRNVMSFDLAKKAIDFYRKHSIDVETKSIAFYGGEPLLAFPLIRRAVEYAEEIFHGTVLKFTLTTNATLLTDDMIDFFLKHDFTMVFSLDGPKSIQDRNRVFPNGHGTYDIVMSKIFRMYESDPNKLKGDAISMVVTPEHSFDEIIQLLSEPTLQNVNLLYSYVEENSETILPSREYLEQYRYCSFVSLVEYLRGQGKMYQNKLMESDMTGIEADLDRFTSHELVNTSAPSGPCIPGRNRLFVNCFGSFYPCEKVSEDFCMNIGSIDSGFDVSKVASILNIGQLDSQKCQNCFAFALCSVCAKYVDGGESLSVEKREKACQESKNSAYNQILERILFYENSLHLSSIKMRKEVKV